MLGQGRRGVRSGEEGCKVRGGGCKDRGGGIRATKSTVIGLVRKDGEEEHTGPSIGFPVQQQGCVFVECLAVWGRQNLEWVLGNLLEVLSTQGHVYHIFDSNCEHT